jgi:hypothetical protein
LRPPRPHLRLSDRAGAQGLTLNDEATIKFYLLRYRSINPGREIREQLERSSGRNGSGGPAGLPADDEQVAMEWARTHSAAWREHRVTTIVYVFEQEKSASAPCSALSPPFLVPVQPAS